MAPPDHTDSGSPAYLAGLLLRGRDVLVAGAGVERCDAIVTVVIVAVGIPLIRQGPPTIGDPAVYAIGRGKKRLVFLRPRDGTQRGRFGNQVGIGELIAPLPTPDSAIASPISFSFL